MRGNEPPRFHSVWRKAACAYFTFFLYVGKIEEKCQIHSIPRSSPVDECISTRLAGRATSAKFKPNQDNFNGFLENIHDKEVAIGVIVDLQFDSEETGDVKVDLKDHSSP